MTTCTKSTQHPDLQAAILDDFRPDERLAVYGTLRPGQANAHILEPIDGIWLTGWVRGDLKQRGWGASHGCPGIRLALDRGLVRVDLFCSHRLPEMWSALDAFEGAEYRRAVAPVMVGGRTVAAQIYELA